MHHRTEKKTLERQLFISFVSVSTVLVLLTLGITLFFEVERQNRDIDATISSTAAYIASMDSVVEMLENGYPNTRVKTTLDSLAQNFSGLNVIAVYNTQGLRFYHTNRQQTGETFVRGDETAILTGSAPYITTGYGTYGTQRRAFHAIENEDGAIIGFVMTSIFQSGIREQTRTLILSCLLILCSVFGLGLLLSRVTVWLLTRSLMGHHPTELLDLYLQQDEVLNSIQEGLVATNADGTVVFSNLVARQLFTETETPLQSWSLKALFPETACDEVLRTGVASHNRSCIIRDHQVLVSEIPLRGEMEYRGVLNIFHDKTEMMKISDELSGTKYMLDTLRFFNHEFMNKLHVILGYLQTGETRKAMDFIMNSSLLSSQAIRETADSIRISRLCALIIGKMMHAAELGILLTVSHDSCCMEHDLLLPVGDCVTLIGNLLENAIEEMAQSQPAVREINLGIYCRPDCNLFLCEDTGGGIPPDLLPHIFEKGVSSKGKTRGLGLYLVQQLVEENGGTLGLETEKGVGTCFTLTFTKREG